MYARRSICVLLGLALVIVAQTPPAAQTRPAAAADIPRLQFEKYALPNGLEVILSQNRRLPVVAVNLWYHVGPANEEPGRTGFAHLFEHMMFQGSKHVPPDGHFQLLEKAGATGLNGTTDYDRTNYFETVPANQLELALWLESDRMGYLLEKVDQAALSNQQDVVRNERRQSVENQPYGLAEETIVQTLFPKGHPYFGNVIGSHEDIQAVKLDDVNRFFRQYYAPNNASVAIVGDFDVMETKRLVEKYFGGLKTWPGRPSDLRRYSSCHGGTARGGPVARRAPTCLHDLADPAHLQGWRCGRRGGRQHPRRRAVEPAIQGAGLRKADRPERCGVSELSDSRLDVPDPGDGAARAHRRGTRARNRRGAGKASSAGALVARNRAGAEHDRDRDHRRAGAIGRVWRCRRQVESVQPLSPNPRLSGEGHSAIPRRHPSHAAGVCTRSAHDKYPRGGPRGSGSA